MIQKTTSGVLITVETFYQKEYSNPTLNEFMFAYRVTIKNYNTFPIKVLKRHWDIFDSDGSRREVDGEGVVGMTPVISQGNEYQYVSGCNLHTDIGSMGGYYTAQNLDNKQMLTIQIPTFWMVTPMKLN